MLLASTQVSLFAPVAEILLALVAWAACVVGVAASGVVPSYVQRKLLSRQGVPSKLLWPVTPLCILGGILMALVIPSSMAYILARDTVAAIASDRRLMMAAQFSAALGAGIAAMLISVAWWDAVRTVGIKRAPRYLARVVPAAGAYLVVAGILFAILQRRGISHEKFFSLGAWCVLGVLIVIGLNAGGIARALANRGLDRFASLAVAAFPTVSLLLFSWFVFVKPTIEPDRLVSIREINLEGATTAEISLGVFTYFYLVLVFSLGVGGWIGIRLAPTPRMRDMRNRIDPRLREAEFASVAALRENRNEAASGDDTPRLRLVGSPNTQPATASGGPSDNTPG